MNLLKYQNFMKRFARLLILMIGIIGIMSCTATTTIAEKSESKDVIYDVGDNLESVVMSIDMLEIDIGDINSSVLYSSKIVDYKRNDEWAIININTLNHIKFKTEKDNLFRQHNDVGKSNFYLNLYKAPNLST